MIIISDNNCTIKSVEKKIIQRLLRKGFTHRQIASKTGLSERTVERRILLYKNTKT